MEKIDTFNTSIKPHEKDKPEKDIALNKNVHLIDAKKTTPEVATQTNIKLKNSKIYTRIISVLVNIILNPVSNILAGGLKGLGLSTTTPIKYAIKGSTSLNAYIHKNMKPGISRDISKVLAGICSGFLITFSVVASTILVIPGLAIGLAFGTVTGFLTLPESTVTTWNDGLCESLNDTKIFYDLKSHETAIGLSTFGLLLSSVNIIGGFFIFGTAIASLLAIIYSPLLVTDVLILAHCVLSDKVEQKTLGSQVSLAHKNIYSKK